MTGRTAPAPVSGSAEGPLPPGFRGRNRFRPQVEPRWPNGRYFARAPSMLLPHAVGAAG